MTPFYKKALSLFTRTQQAQIEKGLQKYPNAFNPHEWTPDELLNHALEETVDLTHYLVGLKELLDVKDEEITRLKMELSTWQSNAKMKAQKLNYDINFNPVPPYFDQDDQ